MIATADNNAIVVLNDYINDYITIAATRVLRACVNVNGNRSSTATTAAAAATATAATTATATATAIIITDVIIEAAVVIPIVAIIVDGV